MVPVSNDVSAKTNRLWEIACHASALSLFVGIPCGNILGPLLVWLFKKGESGAIDEHGKEALNFQLSLSLYLLVLMVATGSLMIILIGFLLLPLLIAACIIGPLVDLIFIIIASVKASNGELYRYPCTIRFIK